MENAVKALLMAAGVLIGLMIISLGVSLYSSLREYVEFTHKEIASNEIQQFNEQFFKYINYNTITMETEFTLTIQDIVTAANIANENNSNTDYTVTVILEGLSGIQEKIKSNPAEILENGLGKQYRCSVDNIEINPTTGRVNKVTFYEI